MEEKQCPHEDRISYLDLLQVDGEPIYTVVCEDCRQYGIIKLIEGENEWGLSKEEVDNLKDDDNKKEEVQNRIDHEAEVLKSFQNGDFSLLVDGWSIEKQEGFVQGMRYVYQLIQTK